MSAEECRRYWGAYPEAAGPIEATPPPRPHNKDLLEVWKMIEGAYERVDINPTSSGYEILAIDGDGPEAEIIVKPGGKIELRLFNLQGTIARDLTLNAIELVEEGER